MHKPFHQKYRPNRLDELVGQKFISITLKEALISNKIAPAYLFNGPRGTGKTSSARIFAKSLNCQASEKPTPNPCGKCELCKQITDSNALDIIEIDAASNTGVENIREIIDRARFAPTLARWKVYVIDECHMLSTAASNALLKTIEEPPARVVFILATTNPERVINTIQSRCQKFDFRRIETNTIFDHLCEISKKESIKFEERALKLIAKRSNGGMRDAQSLLEQVSLMPNGISMSNVKNLLGEVPEDDLINLIESLIKNDPELLLISCNKLYDSGNEPLQILTGLLNISRDLLLKSTNNNYTELYYTSIEFQKELDKFSKHLTKSTILQWHNNLKNVDYQIKTSDNPRLWLEIHLTSLIKSGNINNQNKLEKNTDKEVIKNIDDHNKLEKNTDKEVIKNIDDHNKLEKNTDKEVIKNIDDHNKLEKNTDKEVIKNIDDHSNNNVRLKENWEMILSKLDLPSTKMLLSQQAELVSFNSKEIEIGISPNWENMIKSRKVVIENAAKKVYGVDIKIKFSTNKINEINTLNTLKPQTKNPIEEKNSTPNQDSKRIIPSETNKANLVHNDSPENLANFFNGEIIDLEK